MLKFQFFLFANSTVVDILSTLKKLGIQNWVECTQF